MIFLSKLIFGIAMVLHSIIWLVFWLVLIRVILSWVNADPNNMLVRIIYTSVDPLLHKVRGWLPRFSGGLDFTPLILTLGLMFVDLVLVGTLIEYSNLLLRQAMSGI